MSLSRSGLFMCLAVFGPIVETSGQCPGPFGILKLPCEYQSHRVAFRDTVSQTTPTILADVEGEGCVRHVWMTISGIREAPINGLRLTLRIYVDGSAIPNVEMPVAPFFGIHHGHSAQTINSPFLQITDRAGFNSYFPMPYHKQLRMTLQNDSDENIGVWFQMDYHAYETGALTEPLRFHAAYRRVNPARSYGQPYHIGHSVGDGVIAGITLGMRVFDDIDSWYHCGGDLVLLDGGSNHAHLLSGIGGEDFFGTAWGQDVFSNRSIGTPYYDIHPTPADGEPSITFAAYRFFDRDPIAFTESFWYDFGSLANDISSVIYWYQPGTAMPMGKHASMEDRLPEAQVPAGRYDISPPQQRIWAVCGPFSCENRNQFEQKEFPETGIDLTETAPADFGQYAEAVRRKLASRSIASWHTDVLATFNFVDLTPWFRPRLKTNGGLPVDVSAYATATIQADRPRKSRMRIGHDDWFRLWHNGTLVYDGRKQKGFHTTEIELHLVEGQNRILIKSANRDNTNFRAWVFLFDMLEP